MKILILLLFPLSVFAKTIVFVPPADRIDNTPMARSEIGGYKVEVYSNGVNYKKFTIGNVTAFDVDYPPGKYGLYMQTVDTEGRVSDATPRYILNFDIANPKPPVIQ